MRKALRKAREGFTLIELMIVVAIVGVLAVLAIYGVRKYIANAKTAEARNSLGQMSKDAATQYEKEGMAPAVLGLGASTGITRRLCEKASATIPAAKGSIQGQKYQSTPVEWNVDGAGGTGGVPAGFACLKFVLDQPQYYMYGYTATTPSLGAATETFTATANGDLNGDGVLSTFSVSGTIQAGASGGLVLTVAPNIAETNPEE
jgi:type IV pilus assembly protein PilA